MCGCLSSAPCWGLSLQPRQVPWLGIEPVTLWFSDRHSIHRATPARAGHINSLFPQAYDIILYAPNDNKGR